MELQKQPVNINFAQAVDTKTDPFQLPVGTFLSLKNKVFKKSNRLDKRNGFGELASLPDTSNNFLTTFNGNLTAIGTNINAYSSGSMTWVNKGTITTARLNTLPLIRNNTSQTSCDAAISSNGLICTVYTDAQTAGTVYRYAIADAETGQNIIAPTTIASVTEPPRVFNLGNYFVIVYPATATIKYIAINIYSPTTVTSATNLTTQYTAGGTPLAYDGVVANNNLYVAWNGSDGGGAIRVTYLNSTLTQGTTEVFATEACTIMSICADNTLTLPTIWLAYYNSSGTTGKVIALSPSLVTILAPTTIISSGTIVNITCVAQNSGVTVYYETSQNYSYVAVPTNFISKRFVTQAGVVASASVVVRSVGLASKAFIYNSILYFLAAYNSNYQPSYFLMNDGGQVITKLAYSNAKGYSTKGLSSVNLRDSVVSISYLVKNLLIPVNKTQGSSTSAAVYAQTGVNLAQFEFSSDQFVSSEIGNNLHLSGGMVWAYDGYVAVEQGFYIWPDTVTAVWSATGGSIVAQPDGSTNTDAYFYQVLYEWSDNQGNIFRSAPSIPIPVTTTGSGTSGSITVNIPTLRFTYKTANPVKLVVYRWSVAQQIYYQVTSVTSPTMNNVTVDSVAFVDTLADASIIGNSIIYTTGGVLENIGPPATNAMTLFKSRFFLINAENPDELWFSKQVIPGTPVEMSDLLTLFVSPTVGAQGDTGPNKCCSAMDDKLILFKSNAIYYIVGNGPDNTGANNDFSEPVFITSTVGSSNQNSIVFQPQGLMFESDKGIWLLGRDLSTSYIGADVEQYTQEGTVLSALTVPGTTEVRFTLSSGITLMYDYYYQKWSTFENVPALSSTIFEGLHTFINEFGQVFQESPDEYLDGSNPVLMSLETGWINVAGIQGYQRAYFFYLLGEYISPHKLQYEIAYDFNPAPAQTGLIMPVNFNAKYGDDPGNYGDVSPYGGISAAEKWRVFFKNQKCEAFKLKINEIYDPSFGVEAGAGLTLSGINMIVGVKKSYRTQSAKTSTG